MCSRTLQLWPDRMMKARKLLSLLVLLTIAILLIELHAKKMKINLDTGKGFLV